MIDYLVPNETEAATLTGKPVNDVKSAIEVGRILKARGVQTFTITLGEAGSISVTEAGIIHTPPYMIHAVDVTAAGDSFCASLAYGLMHGKALEKALQFASASGAIAALRKGAQPSLPTLEEIHSFMARKDSRDE